MKGRRTGSCRVCNHPDRGRVDFLLASGATVLAVARQFKIAQDRLYRHARTHITQDYRRSVLAGPLQEENLRKLAAEMGTSVLENLRVIYSGLANRWLVNFQCGADLALVSLTREMHANLERQGRISGELLPHVQSVTNHFWMTPEFSQLQLILMKALMRFPEAKASVIAALEAQISEPPTIEHQSAPLATSA